MNYTGWLADGTVFDYQREAWRAPTATKFSGVIQGWQIGIPGMKVGGIRKLVISAGPRVRQPAQGKIPPAAR